MKPNQGIYTPLVLSLTTISIGLTLVSANTFELLNNDHRFTFAVAVIYVGAFISNLVVRTLKYSDKSKMHVAHVLFMIGYLLSILNIQSFNILASSRFIIGLGIGIANSIVPMYISNTSPDHLRALLTTSNTAGYPIGITIGHIANLKLDTKTIMLACAAFSAVQSFLLAPAAQNTSRQSFSLHKFSALFNNPKSIRSLFVSILLHIAQQTSGINYILIFINQIFTEKYYAIAFNSIAIAATFLSASVIPLVGKPLMLIFSMISTTVAMLCLQYKISPGMSGVLYFIGFNFGLNSIPWTSLDEIFDPLTVDPGSFFAVSVNYILAFLFMMGISDLIKYLGEYHLWFYIVSTTIALLIILIVYPPSPLGKMIAPSPL